MADHIFLSCVTSEFGDLRLRFANFVNRTKSCFVRHQADFVDGDSDTDVLKKLYHEIECSKTVFHIVGNLSGWKIPSDLTQDFLRNHSNFALRFPEISQLAFAGQLSATQWEYWIARFLDRRIYCFSTHNSTSDPMQTLHHGMLENWCKSGRFDFPHFANCEALYDAFIISFLSLGLVNPNNLRQHHPGIHYTNPLSKLLSLNIQLPPPFQLHFFDMLTEIGKSDSSKNTEQLIDEIRQGFGIFLNFSASVLLSIVRQNPSRLLRSKAIKLQQFTRQQSQPNLSNTSFNGLTYTVNLCLESLSSNSPYEPFRNLASQFRDICLTLSNLTPKSSATEAADSIERAARGISTIWADFELIVPTKVEGSTDSSSININQWWRFDSTSSHWRLQNEAVKIKTASIEGENTNADDSILQKLSVLIVSKKSLEFSRQDSSVGLDPEEILSLFPFAFAHLEENAVPELYLYHDLTADPNAAKRVAYKKALRTTNRTEFKTESYDVQDKPFLIESLNLFLKRLRLRIGRDYNLSIRPEAISEEHEYVLCGAVEGRDDQFAMMDKWIENEAAPNIFCWEAFGGDGKSAMVHDWLFRDPETKEKLQELGYTGAIWASFYQPQFDFIEFARRSLVKMQGENRIDHDERKIVEAFFQAAEKEQYLFVLDGLERLLFTELEEETAIHKFVIEGKSTPLDLRRFRRLNIGDGRESQIDFVGENIVKRMADLPRGSSRFLITSRFCPAAVEGLGKQAIVEKLERISLDAAEKIWWKAAKREARNPLETREVRRVIDLLGRHPLTIKIVAASVASTSFSEWRQGLQTENGEALSKSPFDESYEDGKEDTRSRCSEAIWLCGSQLPNVHREYLRKLDKLFSGSISLHVLRQEPTFTDLIGPTESVIRIMQNLSDRHWIGVSQGGFVDLHPMVRQFAKDRRHNLGLSKQAIKDSQEYDKLLKVVEDILNKPDPDYQAAWKRLLRGEPWNRAQKFDHSQTRSGGMRKLRTILLRFLPKTRRAFAFPNLDHRTDQALFFLYLGLTEAYLGEYEKAIESYKTGLGVSELHGLTTLAEDFRSSIQWAAMYDGNLIVAENAIQPTTFSGVLEVCLSLRGAQSTLFKQTPPSAIAFPNIENRRWLYQTLAEASLWCCDLERGQKWLDLMNAEAVTDKASPNDAGKQRSQIMWEMWTNGTFACEKTIQRGEFEAPIYHEALDYLRAAQKEAEESGYRIVAALAIAFQMRLLAFAAIHSKDTNRRNEARNQNEFLYNLFRNDTTLHCRFAGCIVHLSRFTLDNDPITLRFAWELANGSPLGVNTKGIFYFACKHIRMLLRADPSLSTILSLDAQQLPDAPEEVEYKTNYKNEFIQEISAESSNPEESLTSHQFKDWNILQERYGREILLFAHIVYFYDGSPRDFDRALEAVLELNGKLDPLAAITEMIARSVENTDATPLTEFKFEYYQDILREKALIDFKDNIPHAKRFNDHLERAFQDKSTEFMPFLATVFRDSARILKLNTDDYLSETFEKWRHHVPNALMYQNQEECYRLLVPFFETLLDLRSCLSRDTGNSHDSLLTDLIHNLRMPSEACYRASFYRLYYDQVLSAIIEMACGQSNREKLEVWRFAYRCGWHKLDASTRSKCHEIFSRTGQVRTQKLLREMDRFGIILGDLFKCMDETNSENIQGNIYWLKYLRRKEIEDKLQGLEKDMANAFGTSKRDSIKTAIDDLRSQIPFWDKDK